MTKRAKGGLDCRVTPGNDAVSDGDRLSMTGRAGCRRVGVGDGRIVPEIRDGALIALALGPRGGIYEQVRRAVGLGGCR